MAKKREIQEINASSMADISFLLLIFFLVTTSMATDKGLMRRLPAPVPEEEKKEEEVEINERNMMMILINSNDLLMVNNELMDVRDLREKAKEFIANPQNSEKLPAKKMENIPFFGDVMITKDHVISLQNDRGTSYQAYDRLLLCCTDWLHLYGYRYWFRPGYPGCCIPYAQPRIHKANAVWCCR